MLSSYGLLGASGCGKTTVLSCIVGRRALDAGSIGVFGGTPGDRRTGVPGSRIGYMPQVNYFVFPTIRMRENVVVLFDISCVGYAEKNPNFPNSTAEFKAVE